MPRCILFKRKYLTQSSIIIIIILIIIYSLVLYLTNVKFALFVPEELAPTSFNRHLYDKFGAVRPGKRLGIHLSDQESTQDVVNINSPKIRFKF